MSTDARAWLKNASRARVLHIFDEVCNLVYAEDEVLSLVLRQIGDGPFRIVLPRVNFPSAVTSTARISFSEDRLTIGDLSIDVRAAREWDPRPDWDRLLVRRDLLIAAIPDLVATIRETAPADSLARLVVKGPSHESELGQTFLRQAYEPAGQLVSGLRGVEENLLREGTAGLVGLGDGLTPAGDDWIMGCLLGAHIIIEEHERPRMAAVIVEAIAGRTTPLSAALIRAAARGECGVAWHDLLGALKNADAPGIDNAAKRIMSRGHTSGADSLAGFVAVLGEGTWS
jgi:hypothetical protein